MPIVSSLFFPQSVEVGHTGAVLKDLKQLSPLVCSWCVRAMNVFFISSASSANTLPSFSPSATGELTAEDYMCCCGVVVVRVLCALVMGVHLAAMLDCTSLPFCRLLSLPLSLSLPFCAVCTDSLCTCVSLEHARGGRIGLPGQYSAQYCPGVRRQGAAGTLRHRRSCGSPASGRCLRPCT